MTRPGLDSRSLLRRVTGYNPGRVNRPGIVQGKVRSPGREGGPLITTFLAYPQHISNTISRYARQPLRCELTGTRVPPGLRRMSQATSKERIQNVQQVLSRKNLRVRE